MASKKETNQALIEEISFEKRVARLQEIVGILEQNTSTLEEGMKLYKEGMTHSKVCKEQIIKAKHEIKILEDSELKEFSFKN